jgi:hypothetical protein
MQEQLKLHKLYDRVDPIQTLIYMLTQWDRARLEKLVVAQRVEEIVLL